jgi:hypothetical protein
MILPHAYEAKSNALLTAIGESLYSPSFLMLIKRRASPPRTAFRKALDAVV